MKNYYEYNCPVKVITGTNSVEQYLTKELVRLRAKRVILLSNHETSELGIVDKVKEIMLAKGEVAGMYLDIPIGGKASVVQRISDIYRFNNCDCIVAVGDSSVIDTAKAVKLVLSQNMKPITKLKNNEIRKGAFSPLITIPTACGVGNEVSNQIIIHNDEHNGQIRIVSDELFADTCILDSTMIEDIPQKKLLTYVYYAIANVIESVCSQKAMSQTARVASVALTRMFNILTECLENGGTEEDRRHLLEASSLAGVCISNNPRGECYAIANALSVILNVSAEMCMPDILYVVAKDNIVTCRDKYEFLLYSFIGAEHFSKIPADKRAETFVDYLRKWYEKMSALIGGVESLVDLGFSPDKIPDVLDVMTAEEENLLNQLKITPEYVSEILMEAVEL